MDKIAPGSCVYTITSHGGVYLLVRYERGPDEWGCVSVEHGWHFTDNYHFSTAYNIKKTDLESPFWKSLSRQEFDAKAEEVLGRIGTMWDFFKKENEQ